jgi:hypothetical protein
MHHVIGNKYRQQISPTKNANKKRQGGQLVNQQGKAE